MKSSVAVEAMLTCQRFQFPTIWTMTSFLSNKICVLQFCLINSKTVPINSFDHFLLVNTRTFENNQMNSDKRLLTTALIVRIYKNKLNSVHGFD